jgi:hypothetical protein
MMLDSLDSIDGMFIKQHFLPATQFVPLRHIDAALYDLSPPKVTTLYAIKAPTGDHQTLRYDDGTGDELSVPLCTTACE